MSKEDRYGIRELHKDFPDEDACLTFIFESLHNKKCSCGGEYRIMSGRKSFQCSKCSWQIAPCGGSVFHKSSTPLTLWFKAILTFSNAKSGVSAKYLQRELNLTYKCAWRILHQIRKVLRQNEDHTLKGTVEMDGAYLNTKASPKIIGAVSRGGRAKLEVVEGLDGFAHRSFIQRNIERGSELMTDSTNIIPNSVLYDHKRVNHHKKEYVRGKVHTNTIESLFGHIKRSIRGTFKVVSAQHLQSYLDAFVFHYDNRGNDRSRFLELLRIVLRGAR